MTPQEVMARALANASRMEWPDDGDIECVEAQIAALEAAGFRIVPVEATEAMRTAGEDVALQAHAGPNDRADCGQIFAAMATAYTRESA